jgi:hypothetical protein
VAIAALVVAAVMVFWLVVIGVALVALWALAAALFGR